MRSRKRQTASMATPFTLNCMAQGRPSPRTRRTRPRQPAPPGEVDVDADEERVLGARAGYQGASGEKNPAHGHAAGVTSIRRDPGRGCAGCQPSIVSAGANSSRVDASGREPGLEDGRDLRRGEAVGQCLRRGRHHGGEVGMCLQGGGAGEPPGGVTMPRWVRISTTASPSARATSRPSGRCSAARRARARAERIAAIGADLAKRQALGGHGMSPSPASVPARLERHNAGMGRRTPLAPRP